MIISCPHCLMNCEKKMKIRKKNKAQRRLNERIEKYERTVDRLRLLGVSASGYHKPGSLNPSK